MIRPTPLLWASALLCAAAFQPALAQTPTPAVPHYDHVVLVIDENKNDTEIRGSALAPYINSVLLPGSADLTHFVAEQHPSQPNYIQLFSGSDQGVKQDGLPGTTAEPGTLAAPPPFHTPNLGREMLNAGDTFATFSESLPSVGFTGETYSSDPTLNEYVRKHNPAVEWQDDTATAASNPYALPSSTNRAFSDFPTTAAGFAALPSFSIVVPNEQNDMHDGSITMGDTWLQNNIEPYRQWALQNNSLLIFTFDESDMGALQSDPNNQIITAISGQNVVVGKYDEAAISRFHLSDAASPDTAINHYNLAATIESIFGTATDVSTVAQNNLETNPLGGSILPITDIFAPAAAPEPSPWLTWTAGLGILALAGLRRRFAKHAAKERAMTFPFGTAKRDMNRNTWAGMALLGAAALLAPAPAHAQDLYVSDFDNNQIREYTSGGAAAQTLASGGVFINPNGIAFAAGSLYVAAADASTGDAGVYHYDLASPSTAPTLFAADAGGTLAGLAFGGGNLYAADSQQGVVFEFDGTSGALLATLGSGTLVSPQGLAFSGSTLYVADGGANDVVSFNADGTNMQTFVAAGAGGLQTPGFLAFDANGNLDVASGQGAATAQNPNGNGAVLRYDGPGGSAPGTFQSVFASDTGLTNPYGLAFSPAGTLFVGDRDSNGNPNASGNPGGHFDKFSAGGVFQQSIAFDGGSGNPYGVAFSPASGPAPAPEPNAAWILGIGMACLGGLRLAARRMKPQKISSQLK